MPIAGYKVDQKETEPLTWAIGKLIVNFGGLELETYRWFDVLTSDGVLKGLVKGMPLGRRIDVIRSLLEVAKPPKKVLKDSKATWDSVVRLSELRNDLAHSPIVLGWIGDEGSRPPDYQGVLPVKRILDGRRPKRLGVKEVERGVNEAAQLAQRLRDLLPAIEQHCKQRADALAGRDSQAS